MNFEKILEKNLLKRQTSMLTLWFLFQTLWCSSVYWIMPTFNKKFELGLIRNHYVGRTFIEPSQQIRSLGVKLKLSSTKSIVKNKSIILVDDSLVRGTTCSKIVKMLYEAGAKEVHVRIACPEINFQIFMELYANKKGTFSNQKN